MLKDTVVVGANGRLGRAVLERCDPSSTSAATRTPGSYGSHIEVGPEGFVDTASLAGKISVINCAGRPAGKAEDLQLPNVSLPERLGQQAKEAGVRHFVQISSLRVFGRLPRIGPESQVQPDSAYAHSKLQGDEAVLRLQSDEFSVTCLRLPFMFSPKEGSMLGRLVALLLKMPVLPVPSPPPRRSMITFEDAAQVIEHIVERGVRGAVNAADPHEFSYALLSQMMKEAAGRRLILPLLPRPALSLLGYAVPAARQSLFSSNVLEPEANLAREVQLSVGLEAALRQLVKEKTAQPGQAPRS